VPGQLDDYERNLENGRVRDAVDWIVGDARKTMIPTLDGSGFCVAFIDVDVYEVVREVLLQLQTIVKGGEIIIVHDAHSPVIRKAIDEFRETARNVKETTPVYATAKLAIL
jgi:predicted O-methyltransferase YrrM